MMSGQSEAFRRRRRWLASAHKMRERRSIESPRVGGRMAMLDFVQQLVSGIALGCVYGLIALGFVLVYKATEVVNFAQGDLMMLGGFFAFTFIGILGLNYWIGFAGAVAAMAAFGMLAERVVVRPILGYPQFSIVMATIGLGYFLRSVAGMIWGTDDLQIDTPFSPHKGPGIGKWSTTLFGVPFGCDRERAVCNAGDLVL